VKRTISDEAFWGMQNAEVEKLIQDFPLLLGNRQDEVDPSEWEKNGHAIRMRMERTLEAMAEEGDGVFEWRRRGRRKGRKVFVFSPLGKERAKLKGLEHEYFLQHHIEGVNRPPYSTSRIETRDRRQVPEEACRHLLIFSVCVARGLGSYVWPEFFFELPRAMVPERIQQLGSDNVKVEQIERTFDQLLMRGYMRRHGTMIVHRQKLPLLYPTRAGFKRADFYLRKMRRCYPVDQEVNGRPDHSYSH